jgi:hypothetical protein
MRQQKPPAAGAEGGGQMHASSRFDSLKLENRKPPGSAPPRPLLPTPVPGSDAVASEPTGERTSFRFGRGSIGDYYEFAAYMLLPSPLCFSRATVGPCILTWVGG